VRSAAACLRVADFHNTSSLLNACGLAHRDREDPCVLRVTFPNTGPCESSLVRSSHRAVTVRVMADATRTGELTILPANEATWNHIQAVFGGRGDPARCWCQRYKMQPRESWASVGRDELAVRLRQQTGCGHPEADATSGLVAYLGGEPVGWCAVEPRNGYARLLRNSRVPWEGRDEDRLTRAFGR